MAGVFGLLSDETRVDILRAIALAESERHGVNVGPTALSFSEVYDRVDVENTSKLSYHLGELTGTFLRKSEDGYSFTHLGERFARLILSENHQSLPDFEPRETAGTCPFCEASPLRARLHYQFLVVECPDCERPVSNYQVTPAQARARDEAELVRSVERKQALDYAQVRRGVCPACSGSLSADVRDAGETPLPDADPFLVVDRCEQCLRRYSAPLTYGAAYHPASVAFHWDHGVDVTTSGLWTFHEHVVAREWTSERVATDPAAYEVVFRHDGDRLRCHLDATATVTGTERVRRR